MMVKNLQDQKFSKGEWVCPDGVTSPQDFIGIYIETTGTTATINRGTGNYLAPFNCYLPNLRRAPNAEVAEALNLHPGDVVLLANYARDEDGRYTARSLVGRNGRVTEQANSEGQLSVVVDGQEYRLPASMLHIVSRDADQSAFEKGEWVCAKNSEGLQYFIGIYDRMAFGNTAILVGVTEKYRGDGFYCLLDNLHRATDEEVVKALDLKPGDVVKLWRDNNYPGLKCLAINCKKGWVQVEVGDGISQTVVATSVHLVSRAAEPAARLYRQGDVIQTPHGRQIVHFSEIAHQRFINGWPSTKITLILAADDE